MKRISSQVLQLIRASLIAGTFIFSLVCPNANADEVSQEQLDSVTAQLNKTHKVSKQAKQLLTKLQKQLKSDELKLSRQNRTVAKTSSQVREQQQHLDTLKDRQQELKKQQQQQRELLSKQIAAAYQMGYGDYLKMLLNQDKSSDMERTMGYYQYLNQARLKALDALTETTHELAQNEQEQQQRLAKLQQLLDTQKEQQQQLAQQRQARQRTVKKTNRLLANNQLKAQQLNQAKAYLARELANNAIPKIKLSGLKHRAASWPVKGHILHDYNTPQLGGSHWDGVVLKAKAGTPVKAIADGQVVFADWLRGYGLVIVLSHGHNYLSLYGYNESLLHEVGDKIAKGEPIATVGNSGGQEQNSLYFQIRYKSNVENPHRFIR